MGDENARKLCQRADIRARVEKIMLELARIEGVHVGAVLVGYVNIANTNPQDFF